MKILICNTNYNLKHFKLLSIICDVKNYDCFLIIRKIGQKIKKEHKIIRNQNIKI